MFYGGLVGTKNVLGTLLIYGVVEKTTGFRISTEEKQEGWTNRFTESKDAAL